MTTKPQESRTALITGASAGLGVEYARQLAQRGYNLLITARRADRLQFLSDELTVRYPIRVEILSADLAEEAGVRAVEQAISRQKDLALLVNNAGFGISGGFTNAPLEKHLMMIQVHINASVRLAKAALDVMIPNRSGAIINVASMAAFLPIRNSTYSATKAYLVSFSEALDSEVGSLGIHAQALCPGFTYTEFHDTPDLQAHFSRRAIPGWLWLKADMVIRDSLNSLGRGVICIPGWQYKLVYLLVRSPLTSALALAIARFILKRKQPKPPDMKKGPA